MFSQTIRSSSAMTAATPAEAGFSASFEIKYNELTFGDEIGNGTYSQVYKGTYHNQTVAIKTLKKPSEFQCLNDFTQALHYFREEKEIMKKLHAPNMQPIEGIVKFLGYSEQSNPQSYHIVMEYLPQGDLCDLISNYREHNKMLDWSLCYKFLNSITDTVKCLHEQNVVHCDLKSANFFLSENGEVKIGDFGCAATLTDGIYKSTFLRGTSDYVAPEAERSYCYNPATDAYALGTVICEVTAQCNPANNSIYSANLIAQWIQQKTTNLPKDGSFKLANLIKRCWDRSPNRRPTTTQINAELKQIAEPQTSTNTDSSSSPAYKNGGK
jgi:serine/threonine protein kinase